MSGKCGRHIPIVIVIAEDREHTEWCLKAAERICARPDIRPIPPRNVIPTQHDQVRLLDFHQRRRPENIVEWDHLAVMQIGNEPHSEPLEYRRKAGNRNGGPDDLYLMPRIRRPIGRASDRGAHTASE